MSARAIVSGALFRKPVEKISKAGAPYILATIRDGNGEAARWWKVFVFNKSAIEEISALDDGEPIAVAGEFDAEMYAAAGGKSRLSWKIVADAILSARRKPKAKAAAPARAIEAERAPFDERRPPLDGAIPF